MANTTERGEPKMANTVDTERVAGVNEARDDAPYLIGRLLAEVDAAQRRVRGPAATTVGDKYYRHLAATPRTALGRLIERYREMLPKLQRTKPAAARAIESRVVVLISRIEDVPERCTPVEQGAFALGYYHQKAEKEGAAA